MGLGDIYIKATPVSGASAEFRLTGARVEHILSPSWAPLAESVVSGDQTCAAPDVTVQFVEGCLPEWPVYIRWINRLGGFEFHMFKGRKTYTEEVDRGDTYVLAEAADLDATATRGQLPGEVSRTLACGAGGLDFDMWEFLKGVALSPAVWIYDTTRGKFVQVTLKDTSIEWDSGNATGSVDFEFNLIDEGYMV